MSKVNHSQEFHRLAEEAGVEVEYTSGYYDRPSGMFRPFSITLDSPPGKCFVSSGAHSDMSIQGEDGKTKTDWKYALGELGSILEQGFEECEDPDCDICNAEEDD